MWLTSQPLAFCCALAGMHLELATEEPKARLLHNSLAPEEPEHTLMRPCRNAS